MPDETARLLETEVASLPPVLAYRTTGPSGDEASFASLRALLQEAPALGAICMLTIVREGGEMGIGDLRLATRLSRHRTLRTMARSEPRFLVGIRSSSLLEWWPVAWLAGWDEVKAPLRSGDSAPAVARELVHHLAGCCLEQIGALKHEGRLSPPARRLIADGAIRPERAIQAFAGASSLLRLVARSGQCSLDPGSTGLRTVQS